MKPELFEAHKPIDDKIGGNGSFIRNDYIMAIIGVIDSPIGKRRIAEMTPPEMEKYGQWNPCDTPPAKSGLYLLCGDYENFDGTFPDAILPCWYHADYKEWEASDGFFEVPKQWMHIPWIPELWEFCEQKFARECPALAKMGS